MLRGPPSRAGVPGAMMVRRVLDWLGAGGPGWARSLGHRLAGWVVRRLVRLFLLVAVLLITAVVVVSWGVQEPGPDRAKPGRDAGLQRTSPVTRMPHGDSLARVNCVLGPRPACEQYVAAATAYETWKGKLLETVGGGSLGPADMTGVAGAERRVRRAVRRRAFTEAVQELAAARSALADRFTIAGDETLPEVEQPPDPVLPTTRARPHGRPAADPVLRPDHSAGSGVTAGTPAGPDAGEPSILFSVLSDRKTLVVIRGVQALGRFDRMAVPLPPGTYVFQGHREGYAPVRVEVAATPDADPVEVTVICDRPI